MLNLCKCSSKTELKRTPCPQVDYSEQKIFVNMALAFLYYNSSIGRIYDYFPYDGSDAEINEFQQIFPSKDKATFDNLYPRTNGYANLMEHLILVSKVVLMHLPTAH